MSPAGNTCFMNAALQCLRFTPELPLLLIPDILDSLPPPGSPAAVAISTEHPAKTVKLGDPIQSNVNSLPVRPATAPAAAVRPPLGGGIAVEDSTSIMLSLSGQPSSSLTGMPCAALPGMVTTAGQW